MRLIIRTDRGAALVTVLLFMLLVFILITTMLTTTGNEIIISGLHRDSVRALEWAEAGVQEAVRRMEEGRPYSHGFTGSLNPAITVIVTRRSVGTNSAYQEITAAATAGRSTRRVTYLVLQQMTSVPPNITSAHIVSETGSATIAGDVYARTLLEYKNPPPKDSYTYAGWHIDDDNAPACIKPPCAQQPNWHPGHRRGEPATSVVGRAILTWAATAEENCTPSFERVQNNPDYQLGDRLATAPDADVPVDQRTEPLYGFDTDGNLAITSVTPCGLPYRWVREEFGVEPKKVEARWFKTIVFEQWLQRYWEFDEATLTYKKGADLKANPQYGVVPPFPDFSTVAGNYDCRVTGGGLINALPLACEEPDGSTIMSDIGCMDPEMNCHPEGSRPVSLWLDAGPDSWTINGNIQGHGTIVIDGDVFLTGTFEYWGTIIVNGTVTLGAGNITIHGGLVVRDTLELAGNSTLEGGGTISSIPVGRSTVIGKAWWER